MGNETKFFSEEEQVAQHEQSILDALTKHEEPSEEEQAVQQEKSIVSNITKDLRIKQLKAMHKVIQSANAEGIYMSWVMGWIPDCPDEEDFESVAEDDENYNETVDLFIKLVQKKGFRF